MSLSSVHSVVNVTVIAVVHWWFFALPVCAQCRESEHGDSDRSELDHRDHLTSHRSKNPLLIEIPERVHWYTSDQKQNISHGQAGDENVWYTSHRAGSDEYFHKSNVAQ